MSLNPLHIVAAVRLAQCDLKEVDRQLEEGGELNGQWVLLVKLALISVSNVVDLERTVRQIYQSHPEVSAEYRKWSKQIEFAKYVRNILVGHANDRLIAKAIEWKPELHSLLANDDLNADFLVNLFVLETALNTYVDESEKHLVFDGDTDLLYPPNWTRFLIFLTEIVRGTLAFLESLNVAIRDQMPNPPQGSDLLNLFVAAGRTTFQRITKSAGT